MSVGVGSKYYSGFNPLNLGDCALWLDAADTASLTLSGSNVTTWADKSGNGRNASGGVSPTYSSGGVQFSGSSYLTTTAPAGSNSASYFIVFNATNTSSASVLIGGNVLSTVVFYLNLSTLTIGDWNTAVATNPTTISAGTTYLTSGLVNSGTLSIGINGGSLTSGSATYSGSGTLTIGAGYTDNRLKYSGAIYEVLAYSSVLTTTQREQVEGYLAWKWLGSGGSLSSITTFIPTQISGCALWLDAADSTTVSLSGSNITGLTDKSANRYVLSNASNFTYNQVKFNGSYPSFYTTGSFTSGHLGINSAFRLSQPFTAFVVGQATAASGQFPYILDSAPPSPSSRVVLYYWNNAGYRVRLFAGSEIEYNTGASAPFVNTYRANTTSSEILLNGKSVATGSIGSGSLVGIIVGNANANDSTQIWGGHICEILLYNSLLSTTQRQQVENYLSSKWGISRLGLPTTHPYSSILPVARPFQPIDIGGCALWLDAADPSTVTLSGSNVTQWNDKSGNGYNAIQNVTGRYPTYSNSAVNGLSVIQTSSGGTTLYVPSVTVTLPVTAILVSRKTGTGGFNAAFFELGADTNTNAGFYLSPVNFDFFGVASSTARQFFFDSAAGRGTAAYNAVGTTYVYAANLTPALRVNGSAVSTSYSLNTGSPTGSVTAQLNIGSRNQTSLYGDVQYCEILVYSGNLSTSNLQQVEGYLARKWGFQGSSSLTTFIPTQVSNCALWLDAADSSTLTLSGTDVSQWRDKSGSSNHMNRYSAATAPSTSTLNGYSTVYFNTSDPTSAQYTEPFTNIKVLRGTNFQTTSNSTVFLVATPMYTSTNTRFIVNLKSRNATSWANLYDWTFGTGNGAYSSYVRTDTTLVGADASYYASNATSLTAVQVTGTSVAFYNNGSVYSSGTLSATMPASDAFQVFTIGGYLNTDPYDFVSKQGARIHFNEILVYNGSPTTQERQQIEGYLARKWGLAGRLPSTHPYALQSLPSTHPFISRLPMTTSFNPRQISNCILWLDAADPTTLTLSGSNVTQWSDKSGTANHAVTSTRLSWLGPTVTSSNALRFTRVAGTSLQMLRTQAGRQTTTASTHFLVMRYLNDNASGVMFDMRKASDGLALLQIGAVNIGARGSTSAYLSTTYAFPTTFTIMSIQLNTNSFVVYANSTLISNSTATLDMPAGDTQFTTIGALADLNVPANSSTNMLLYTASSEFYEILQFNAFLTTEQRQQVEGYLARKWGLTGNLPSTHPYKTISLI